MLIGLAESSIAMHGEKVAIIETASNAIWNGIETRKRRKKTMARATTRTKKMNLNQSHRSPRLVIESL